MLRAIPTRSISSSFKSVSSTAVRFVPRAARGIPTVSMGLPNGRSTSRISWSLEFVAALKASHWRPTAPFTSLMSAVAPPEMVRKTTPLPAGRGAWMKSPAVSTSSSMLSTSATPVS